MSWVAVGVGVAGAATSLYSTVQGSKDAEKARKGLPQGTPADEFSERGINLRRYEAFPRILETRRDFDKQFLEADVNQLDRADSALRQRLEGDALPSVMRQREALFSRGVRDFNQQLGDQGGAFRQGLLAMSPELQRAGQGLEEEDEILKRLRADAIRRLDRGGDLSAEEIRDVEQQTNSAVGSRGRGAGAFGVGQLALNRVSARRAREAENIGYGYQAYGLGAESQRRNLAQASQFTSPFLNILSQNQQNAQQTAGTPLAQLMNSAAYARQATPEIPVFDPSMMSLESLRLGQGLGGAQLQQQAAQNQQNATAGLGGGLLSLGGSMYGAGGFGGGGNGAKANYSMPTSMGYQQYGSGSVPNYQYANPSF